MRNANPKVPYYIGLDPKLKKRYDILKANKKVSAKAMQARLRFEFEKVCDDAESEAHLRKETSKVVEGMSSKESSVNETQ